MAKVVVRISVTTGDGSCRELTSYRVNIKKLILPHVGDLINVSDDRSQYHENLRVKVIHHDVELGEKDRGDAHCPLTNYQIRIVCQEPDHD